MTGLMTMSSLLSLAQFVVSVEEKKTREDFGRAHSKQRKRLTLAPEIKACGELQKPPRTFHALFPEKGAK